MKHGCCLRKLVFSWCVGLVEVPPSAPGCRLPLVVFVLHCTCRCRGAQAQALRTGGVSQCVICSRGRSDAVFSSHRSKFGVSRYVFGRCLQCFRPDLTSIRVVDCYFSYFAGTCSRSVPRDSSSALTLHNTPATASNRCGLGSCGRLVSLFGGLAERCDLTRTSAALLV